MPQLSCRNLTLGYEGTAIVSGISFDVNTGDYLSIVGDNGSGKSTLMKTILKLQPPLSGNISTGDGLLASGIGYLPQQTAVQKDFPASVREIVRSGCLNRRGLRPFYSAREKQSADKNMEKLGVAHLAGRCYRELSGGQQQRVLLARALCAAAQIILLDEPTAGLDPKAAGDLYDTIKGLNDGGVTVIMISHDVAASVKYSSHILHIGVGVALYFGTAAEYLTCDAGSGYSALGGD